MPISRRTVLAAGLGVLASGAWCHGDAAATDADADAQVLVVGAGMAGLYAARLLQDMGVAPVVLEGSPRVGGRCWTQHIGAARFEFGAVQVGSSYARVRNTARQLGVALVPPDKNSYAESHLPGTAFSAGGRVVSADSWERFAGEQLPKSEQVPNPLSLMGSYVRRNNPFEATDDWLKPEFARFDGLSMRRYLTELGMSTPALQLLEHVEDLDGSSATEWLRKDLMFRLDAERGSYDRVRDGTSALTDAMAASLQRPVLTNKVVRRISLHDGGVIATCGDGSTYRSRFAVCTMPFSVLRNTDVEGAAYGATQRDVVRTTGYAPLMMVYLRPLEPYWEQDGAPIAMWSDGAVQRVFYTNSNVSPLGQLFVYIKGPSVSHFRGMTQREIGAFALRELERIRPATRGRLEFVAAHDWFDHPFARGHAERLACLDVAGISILNNDSAGTLNAKY